MIQPELDATKCSEGTVSVIPFEIAFAAGIMCLAVLFAPVDRASATTLNETMIAGFIGFLLFLIAKISLVTSGRVATWGASRMRPPFRLAYYIGYGLMSVSSLATFEVIL